MKTKLNQRKKQTGQKQTGLVENQRRQAGQKAHNEDGRAGAIFGGEIDWSVKTRGRAFWLRLRFRGGALLFALAFGLVGLVGTSGRVGHVIGRHTEKFAARLHKHPILNGVGPFDVWGVVTLTSVIVNLLFVTTFLLLVISVAFR
jgi:hypothetical protein